MDRNFLKIGFGGGCHWCTEAVFQALKGVAKVQQGWIASFAEQSNLSEAVIVHYDRMKISLEVLIEIHLRTHKSGSNHSMRKKYRSAIYSFNEQQGLESKLILENLKNNFDNEIITEVYPFNSFSPSNEQIQNYYKKNPLKPFCVKYIDPKLDLLTTDYGQHMRY